MEWDNYRYKIQGYCAEKGMSAMLKKSYVSPKNREEDQELQEWLMGILLQTTEDVVRMVVRPFAERGDGVGAWRALISRYGNDSLELRQAKQIEYTQKVYNVKYEDRRDLLDTMHVLEHLFVGLDKLECELPGSYKRNNTIIPFGSHLAFLPPRHHPRFHSRRPSNWKLWTSWIAQRPPAS